MNWICGLALTVVAVLATGAAMAEVQGVQESGKLVLRGGELVVRYDVAAGTFTAACGKRTFVTAGRLFGRSREEGRGIAKLEPGKPLGAGKAKLIDVRDTLGAGKAVEVSWDDGRVVTLALYDCVPFVCLRGSWRNTGDKGLMLAQVTPLDADVDCGAPAGDLAAFGPEGCYDLPAERTNYAFAAVASRKTRAGVVCGFLSHHRGSGVVTVRRGTAVPAVGPAGVSPAAADGAKGSRTNDKTQGQDGPGTHGQDARATLEAQCQYGRVEVAPGQQAAGEVAAIGWFDDAVAGLETYASCVAKAHDIRLGHKIPDGYCTWYHARALDEKRMVELAEWSEKHLKDYGFCLLQIDDGWQVSSRDFSGYNPKGPYPSGMKPTAETIRGHGMLAGIWFIPFGWDHKREIFRDHQDLFVQKPGGGVYSVHWAGDCMDCTNPKTISFLREQIARMTRGWGYNYIKIDGLWTGMAVNILYPQPHYRADDLGQVVLHDMSKTQVEAYRTGLKLVREASGADTFILGCNIAQNMRTMGGSVGLVDGMRIGPDVGANWGGILSCVLPTSHMWFWHGKVWYNDPDCLMLRSPLTLDQSRAWGTVIALLGQMNLVSEWMPALPAEKLEVVKRTMPNPGLTGRPVDLFEHNRPQVFQLTWGRGERAIPAGAGLRGDDQPTLNDQRRDTVGLFNWEADKSATVGVDLRELGLSDGAEDRYVGFDYWENAFVPPFTGKLWAALKPSSCRAVTIQRLLDRPQVLSTSRHVTGGLVDLVELAWSDKDAALSGRSRVVGGDGYELRMSAPPQPRAWKALSAEVSPADKQAGVTIRLSQEGPWVRVAIDSPATREVAWTVKFERAKTPASDGPAKVARLQAQAPDARTAKLSWEGSACWYLVIRGDGQTATTAASSWQEGTLRPDTQYEYSVQAFDWLGLPGQIATAKLKTPALPPPPPAPPAPQVYLDELKPLRVSQGWGQTRTGKSAEGKPLRLAGKTYQRGIGTHAAGQMTYKLDAAWGRFVATCGIDDEKADDERASVVCRVVVDGKTLGETPVLRAGQIGHLDVKLPDGAKEIRLETTDAGDDNKADHADWVNAGFLRR